jgi:Abnormal spindle-like microcephaly-assoc'd, ASPM-SPD-2-Hydin/Beta-propeller repeat
MKMRASWIRIAGYVAVTIIVTMLLVVATRNQRNQINNSRPQSLLAPSAKIAANSANRDSKWNEAYGKLPLSFQENLGQTDPQVRFISSGSGYKLFLTAQEAVLKMQHSGHALVSPRNRAADLKSLLKAREAARAGQQTAVLRMRLRGTNPQTEITGLNKLPGKTDYFIGSDPKAWRTNVPSYGRVKYSEVYPGVDLIFYGNQRRLEYDFVVAPGASPKAIAFDVEGARKMQVNAHGDLVVSVPEGEVELQRPLAYQEVAGERRTVEAAYTLSRSHRVAFTFAAYDSSKPLVVDPVLNYSTYLGGSGDDASFAIAVDALGDAFVAGETISTDFPTTANGSQQEPQPSNTVGAVFVTELNPTGTAELYSSYLIGTPGAFPDSAFGIAVDPSGNAYVTGVTFSTNFPPTANALKPGPLASNANGTAFLSKINPLATPPNASLVYSTYLGGTGGDHGDAVAVDAAGNAYVVGLTASTDFTQPTVPNGFQTSLPNTSGSAFLAKINTKVAGTAGLIYSTYLGGNGANAANLFLFGDNAFGVTIDATGNAYLVGTTTSTNFPSAGNALQPTVNASNTQGEGFVSKINTTLSGAASLTYSTYLGGSNLDAGSAVALGPNNVIYVTGTTASADFPTTAGAFSNVSSALGVVFVSLIDTTVSAPTSSLTYSSLISQSGNGTGGDLGLGVATDSLGNAYLTGGTGSTNFPVTKGAFQPQLAAGASGDAFLTKLNPGGNGPADLIYSTYFGGSGGGANSPDVGNAIAIDATNNVYIAGQTFSTAASFPFTSGAFQTALVGNSDAFVAKLPLVPTVVVTPSVLNFGTIQDGVTSASQTVTLTNNTTATLTLAVAITDITPPAPATDFAISSSTCGANVAAGGSCTVSVTFTPTLNAAESATLVFTDSDASSPQNVSLTGTGTTVAADFTLTGPANFTVKDGTSGNFNVTLTSVGGFNSPVNLTCTGEPRKSTCTVQSPVTPTAEGAIATVTVTTDVKNGMAYVAPDSLRTPPLSVRQIVLLLFALSLVFALPLVRRRGTRIGLAGAMLACVLVAGCGNNGTPKGTSTLSITGTSGNLTHTATVTLKVD